MSSYAKHPLLLAAATAHSVVTLLHTSKGLEQFKAREINLLPTALRGAVKAGWYEGSVFFAIMGILNYKWSQTGLIDMADKSIAGLFTTMLFGAGAHYYRTGDKPSAILLVFVGVLQAVGARKAAL